MASGPSGWASVRSLPAACCVAICAVSVLTPMPNDPTRRSPSQRAGALLVAQIIRPHWKALAIALLAVLGETLADVLEPWPIKIVIDNVLQSRHLPGRWGAVVFDVF